MGTRVQRKACPATGRGKKVQMVENTIEDELHAALSEQQRELMAAKTLGSDLDLAYHLQMQEAMRASLALQPSSSSRPAPPPVPQPNDAVSSLEDNVLDAAATLMLQDLERFEQEREDEERSKAEIRKAMEELDRRIHDQKFAAYILDIPEEDWGLYGDNYHCPYRSDASSSSSSSSSTALVDTECFRLYTRGFVRKESVRDMKVTVAGAGVAICDSKDVPVLEMSKNLEPLMDGEVVTVKVVELKALIEGLNQALTLGLKRLTLFCDDHKLYQFISGEKESQQSRIATLVNEVALLRRKFTYCNPSLVARNHMKYAYKSARNAVVSQITRLNETSHAKLLMETCVICFEDTDVGKMFSVDGCLHRYCLSCMKQHVEVKLLAGMVAKCPHEGCNSELNIDSCRKFLAPELFEVLSQKMKESSIPITEKVYCPYPKCSALMSKSEVLQYTKTAYVAAERNGIRRCMKCHYYFCINCKVPWHFNMTCLQYKTSEPYFCSEDAKLESLKKAKRWSECVKCHHIVELAEGCYHITCRCGYEFCYTCGAEWKNKKPTCHCPIWDEHNIIRDGGRRR